MCAECHSTGVRKNYDAAKDRFATRWTEISIGCEACHGQGSAHVAWAKDQKSWWPYKSEDPDKGLLVRFDERSGVTWGHDAKTGFPVRSASPAGRKEVETCGLCHARRGLVSEDWVPGRPLSDTHLVAALSQGLYQPDGQMLDEVYNYGSFKQSKMYAAGVTCSDCHDPHSAKLKLRATRSACNATPTHTLAPRIIITRVTPRSVACPAICRSGPSWWSTSGTITASAFHGPIFPTSFRRGMPAPIATRTSLPPGRLRRSRAGSGLSGRAYKLTARPSMRHGTMNLARQCCSPRSRRTRTLRRSRVPARLPGSRLSLSGECRPGAERASGSRPDGAHRRARHARRRAAGSALAVRLAALNDPIRGVRLRAVSLLAGAPSDRLSRRRARHARPRQCGVHRRTDLECRQAGGAGGARQFACTARRDGRG